MRTIIFNLDNNFNANSIEKFVKFLQKVYNLDNSIKYIIKIKYDELLDFNILELLNKNFIEVYLIISNTINLNNLDKYNNLTLVFNDVLPNSINHNKIIINASILKTKIYNNDYKINYYLPLNITEEDYNSFKNSNILDQLSKNDLLQLYNSMINKVTLCDSFINEYSYYIKIENEKFIIRLCSGACRECINSNLRNIFNEKSIELKFPNDLLTLSSNKELFNEFNYKNCPIVHSSNYDIIYLSILNFIRNKIL